MRRCAIAVMAKAPRAGRVKTRLSPPLSAEEAMAMSAAFLRDVTENIRAAGAEAAIDGHIAYAPAGSEALFDGLLAPGTGLVLADGAIEATDDVQGFGRSLLHAARALFDAGYPAACLLNADSPTLPTGFLRDCAEALAEPGDRIVLGAAEDGGYYIIGMKAPHPRLFGDIDWSTDRVAAQTRARAAELGLPVVELPVWYDVDDHASLRRLLRETAAPHDPGAAAPYAAPATTACIARLALAARVGGPGEG
jgi:rSAM/selenodomain-associated transferase 1